MSVGCVVCGGPTGAFLHGGSRKRCDRHAGTGIKRPPAVIGRTPGLCKVCGDPTRPFDNGKARKRCDKHQHEGGRTTTTERHREHSRAYVERNRDTLRIKWRLATKANAPKRAAFMAATDDGTLTVAAVVALFAAARECLYCGLRMWRANKSLDHVVPLSRGGAHSIHNAAVCCRLCNTSKGRKLLSEWQPIRHGEEKDSRHRAPYSGSPVVVHSLVL